MNTPRSQTGAKKRILFLYRRMIPSNATLDVLFQELLRREKIEYRSLQEMRVSNRDLNWADMIVLGRFDSWYESKLARRLRKAGCFLIDYIDDDLPHIPAEIDCSVYYGRKDIHRYILDAIANSHAIMAPSPNLLKQYATDGRLAIQCTGAAICPAAYQSHANQKTVKIGFAGSYDRKNDLDQMLKEALLAVKKKYGDRVAFEFFGAIPDYAEEIQAAHIDYVPDYAAYRQRMNQLEWDIGLAPMPDTPFHACKHYNKFIEYAASAVAGIYSDCAPYDRIPERENKGRYCPNTTAGWLDAISAEIEDGEARELHRRNSCDCAHTLFSLEQVTDRLLEGMDKAFEQSRGSAEGKKEIRGTLLFLKLGNIWFRGTGYLRQNGRNLPRELRKKLREHRMKQAGGR